MKKRPARGARNRNPLNIRIGQDWQGEVPEAQRNGETTFEVFETTAHGFRAGAITLLTYQNKHKLKTVEAMIGRWAPPNENKTAEYVDFVARRIGVHPNAEIDFKNYDIAFNMVKAMAIMETGHDFDDVDINQGLKLAGIQPGNRPLVKTRTAAGGAVAAGAATLGAVVQVAQPAVQPAGGSVVDMVDMVQTVQPLIPLIQDLVHTSPYMVTASVLAGVGYMLYARWQDREQGLR